MLSIAIYSGMAALALVTTMAAAGALVCIIKGLEQLAITSLYWLLALSLTSLTLQVIISLIGV